MKGIDFEALALMALSVVITQTQAQQEQAVDAAAAKVVAAVRDSETKIDDAVAKQLATLISRLGSKITEGLAA